MNSAYIASIVNSTLRSTTPILLAALGCAMCNRVGVFNIALEAQMLIACFCSIVVNFFTGSILLSVLAGITSGALVGAVVAVLQVKYKAPDMVIGTSLNLLINGATTFLLYVIFGLRGRLVDERLVPMYKINLPVIKDIPFLGRVLENLTILDYLCYVIAIVLFIFLFKTVAGYRTLSVGINKEAAESLGTKGTRIQMAVVVLSGALCGLGGTALSMGQVTMFTENMTSGRGFIAMAASSLGMSHPLLVIFSSLFFGLCQGIGLALQNVIKSQLTMALPYIATVVALVLFSRRTATGKLRKS
ncbi:ABC transporter permease [uncultured Oscillibacter sp.]|uniref:ABC transporter permease n=1 Tax=uncultured Oscillibacter sp. TaxID=876091 RepID=UPI00280B779D|nr:ABC transporter permease [uncultured Oscillibacter sp.]